MELGPENHSRNGLLGPNSIMVVYMDPLGLGVLGLRLQDLAFRVKGFSLGFGFYALV